jgi:hypothetical protein
MRLEEYQGLFGVALFIIASALAIFSSNIKNLLFLNFIAIFPVQVFSILSPQTSELEIFLQKHDEKELFYVYEQEINRTDWFYLNKYDIEYSDLENVEYKSKYVLINSKIFLNRHISGYKFYDSFDVYFLLENE